MKAIELNTKTDKSGHLKFDYNLNMVDCPVRVLVLLNEMNSTDDDKIWHHAISNNAAFDFLKEPEEDIYSIQDGEPLND